jgi:hypothetical protein
MKRRMTMGNGRVINWVKNNKNTLWAIAVVAAGFGGINIDKITPVVNTIVPDVYNVEEVRQDIEGLKNRVNKLEGKTEETPTIVVGNE